MASTHPPASIRIKAAGQAYEAPLPARAVLIGKAEACDLRLQGTGIGGEQCVLEPLDDGRHFIRDLGSGYPTKVNGSEIKQVSLRPGDRIEVGDVEVLYAPEAAPAPKPPSPPAESRRTESTPRAPAPRGRRDLTKPLLALATAAVAAIVIALVIGRGGDDATSLAAERRLDEALDYFRARDFASAEQRFDTLLAGELPDRLRDKAERYRNLTTVAIRDAEEAIDRLWERRLDVDVTSVDTQRKLFVKEHGPAIESSFNDTIARIRAAQTTWRDTEIGAATTAADRALGANDFRAARDVWLGLRKRSTVGVSFDAETEAGLMATSQRADASAEALLADAASRATADGPKAAAEALRKQIGVYEGTPAQARIATALERWEREARSQVAAGQVTPEPTTPVRPVPAQTDERALEALADADALAAKRNYVGAVALLHETFGDALPEPVQHRVEDLKLAHLGLMVLAADIEAHPERYRKVQIRPKFFVSLEGADESGVKGALRGARTTYRWGTLSPKALAIIVERTKAEGRPSLALASLLRELGDPQASDLRLVQAVEGGVSTERVFPLLARWRGESPPEGGYQTWEGRYVTPRERRRLERVAMIAALAKNARHKDATVWKAAAEEMLALGEDARTQLAGVLQSRRTALLETIAKHKDFTSGRTKSKLYAELERRRAHALQLIEDARAWPYPNPSGQNTDEVVSRVAAVEEVWNKPFNLVATWSSDLEQRLSAVAEIDAFLVRAEPSFKPNVDELASRVNTAIDMPAYTPDSKSSSVREHSLKVLAYNETVDTTATREEKQNVRAVNEYRMMMGRRAVKIHERLVRGARGHSRHMKTHGYFAHDVPAPHANAQNRSPGARAKQQGYGGGVGENIARGPWTGYDAFGAWFRSSGHHRNMINRGWTEMGAGRSGGTWWTQLFGRMTGTSLKAPDKLPEPPAAFAPEPEDDSGRPLKPGRTDLPDAPPPTGPQDAEPPQEE